MDVPLEGLNEKAYVFHTGENYNVFKNSVQVFILGTIYNLGHMCQTRGFQATI